MNTLQTAKKSKETNWSAIWLLPIVALAITLWLGWQSYQNRGIIIQVEFDNGSGIQANKTTVMYKGIAIGKVTDLRIDNKIRNVIATIEIDKDTAPYLGKKSLFWLVSPKVSLAGVTGLETIVSGVYISVEPVEGPPSKRFVALKKAPALLDNLGGLHLTLQADRLGSLDQGSPVYYRQIQVGQIKSYQLSKDQQRINVNILIDEPYKKLVNRHTRFWNASGITLTGGLSGFKVHTDSIISLISGGIAFDTPEETLKENNPLDTNSPFYLYDDYVAAQSGVKVELKLRELSGLAEGKTAVIYHGVQVGTLSKIKLAKDYSGAVAELNMDPRTESLLHEQTEFWIVKPTISLAGISGLDTLLKGNYIEVHFSKKGKPSRQFTVRAKAPPLNMDAPGLHLILKSKQLASIDVGSPILYKQMKVGSVQSYQLSKTGHEIIIGIHIEPEYAHLINSSTLFWNASGVQLTGNLSGIKVKSESLTTLLMGGIAFDTPNFKASPINDIRAFPLYPNEEKARATGVLITLQLTNSDGITQGTPIKVRGLEVGTVESISLTNDLTKVTAVARITQGANFIARHNSLFWVVKPELGLLKTANLGTLITGTYLEVLPGTPTAKQQTLFIVQSKAPNLKSTDSGLQLLLTAPRRGSLSIGAPVTYKEIPVGKITDFKLSPQADSVIISIIIDPKYAPLVRSNSKFWNTSGIGIEAGLFKGVKVRTESLQTVMEGGIGFATPDTNVGNLVPAGRVFVLHDEAQEEWLKWSPKILLQP